MTQTQPLVILGGTFDPVHRAHIALACAARDALDAEVRLIPNATPPHRRAPNASATDRLAMLRLAIADEPNLSVDTRELERAGYSYTYDTLLSLRSEIGPDRPLILLMGDDAFANLPHWHRWHELLLLTHLLRASRPDHSTHDWPTEIASLWAHHGRHNSNDLRQSSHGAIACLKMPPSAHSSTQVRAALAENPLASESMLVPQVFRYIHDHGLYR